MKTGNKKVEFSPEEHTFRFPLGLRAKDVITGFEGITAYRVQYITGCDQIGLNPGVGKDGQLIDCQQFDENRIEVIGEGIKLPLYPAEQPIPGGPQQRVKSR